MANPNSDTNNKPKNWINRLRNLATRRDPDITSNNDNFQTVVFRRSPEGDTTTCSRTRTSFRKSLKKMHTRVKSVFMNNNTSSNSRHTIHIGTVSTSSASSHSRVTLNSPTVHLENIYSLEPIKKSTNDSIAEDLIFEPPSRIIDDNHLYSEICEVSAEAPTVFIRNDSRRNFPQLSEIQNARVPKVEVISLSNCYWYWGPITRLQAEDRLRNFPDGAFLIRDSSSDRHIFTMSFRSVGRTLHTRIELNQNGYCLFNQGGYHSIKELMNDALTKSKNSVYCYTKSTDQISPNYPVRLTLPVSRYDKVPSLKHLSRFIIRQSISINDIEKLPLPSSLLNYLKEDGSYF